MLIRTFTNTSYIKMIEHIAFEEKCLNHFSFPVNNNSELKEYYIWKGDVINNCILFMDDNSIKFTEFLDYINYSDYHKSKELISNVLLHFDRSYYEFYQNDIEADVFLNLLNFDNFRIDVDKYASCQIISTDIDLKTKYKKELDIIKDMILICYYSRIYDIITDNFSNIY